METSVGSIIMYVIVALAIIIFSVLAVTSRRILRAATYLLFTLFATAAVYFMMDYEFLGAVQIAVYAGGILVLFVFAILLTSRPGHSSEALTSKSKFLGLVAAVATFCVVGWTLVCRVYNALPWAAPKEMMDNPSMHTISEAMLSTSNGGYLLPFEAISVLLLACIIGGVVIARRQ